MWRKSNLTNLNVIKYMYCFTVNGHLMSRTHGNQISLEMLCSWASVFSFIFSNWNVCSVRFKWLNWQLENILFSFLVVNALHLYSWWHFWLKTFSVIYCTCLLKTVLGFPTWYERCSLNQWKICNDLLYFSGHFRPKTHICLRSKGAAEGCFHLGCLSGIMLVSCLVCWQFTLFQFLVLSC